MVDTLFFFCYYAYLQGNLQDTQMYYDILKDEFKSGGKNTLQHYQLLELVKIREALRLKALPKKSWLTSPAPAMPGAETSRIRQDELVKHIHYKCLGQLQKLLDDPVTLYNLEHPCPPYGKVDMVYKGQRTVYPVEVKKDRGEHDLIGQIGKYDLYHRFRLHYGHYDFVRPVTICKTYDKYTLDELKGNGVLTFIYSNSGKDMSLSLI